MQMEELGYLSIGSQLRGIYEKLQVEGDQVYENIGVPFKSSWFPVYYTLRENTRALTVLELTEKISHSRITVKNVVRAMEEVGYVKVISNPSDSRSKLIQLTKKGEGIGPELQPVWNLFYKKLENLFGGDNGIFLNRLAQVKIKLNGQSLQKEVLQEYHDYSVRNADEGEFKEIGELLVEVYSALSGFPKKEDQPEYYDMLRNVGELTENKNIELLTAVSKQGRIGGAVVYFNDMKDYGSGGTATHEPNACGFRLLGVDPKIRGLGLGKLLTQYCIDKGMNSNSSTMVIHTTKSMKQAWGMYERLGFKRADDLDFMQGNLPVFGFRLKLNPDH